MVLNDDRFLPSNNVVHPAAALLAWPAASNENCSAVIPMIKNPRVIPDIRFIMISFGKLVRALEYRRRSTRRALSLYSRPSASSRVLQRNHPRDSQPSPAFPAGDRSSALAADRSPLVDRRDYVVPRHRPAAASPSACVTAGPWPNPIRL